MGLGTMRVDRWSVCPRCHIQHQERIAKAEEKLAASYGNVPIATLSRQRAEFGALVTSGEEYSLREDWDIGMDENGRFSVSYECHCNCGFTFAFAAEKRTPLVSKKDA